MKLAAFHISQDQMRVAHLHHPGGFPDFVNGLKDDHWPGELVTTVLTVDGALHVYRQHPAVPTHSAAEAWQ